MRKIKLVLTGVAAIAAAASVQAVMWTNGVSGDMLFSTASNWTNGLVPTGGDVFSGAKGTTAAKHALVDPAFNIGGTNGYLGNATITASSISTAYVDIQSGAVLRVQNLSLGNSVHAGWDGNVTVKSGGSLNSWGPVGTNVNSGNVTIGTSTGLGAGMLTIEAGAGYVGNSALTLNANGTIKFMFGANAVTMFNTSRSTVGATNTLNGLIQVDLGAYTGGAGTYTLINGITNVLAGALYDTLSGGSISGTGTYSSANFAVLNGGAQQWTLGLADGNKDVVLTLIPEPATLGLFAVSGAVVILLRRMRR